MLTFELYPEDKQIYFKERPYEYVFQRVIMAWLTQIKPEVVHELHEDEKIRPYSINYKIDKKIPKVGFRIITYNDKFNQILIEGLLSDEKQMLKFGEKLLHENMWIKDTYFIVVKHDDFRDCYEKIYITIKSLASKEVWINLIGGTNQINLSLFLSSCLTGIGTKYIYIFQRDITKIHPEIERPDFKNPQIRIPPECWQEIPFIWIGLENEILKEIKSLFECRSTLHIKEIRKILNRYNISQQYLAKLQSSNLIHIENDKVIKGIGFEIIKNFEIESKINDFSNWKKWAKKHDILYQIDINPPYNIYKL